MLTKEKKAAKGNGAGPDAPATVRVCREVSLREICEDCERTTLYPEENCGYPATLVVCEDIPEGPSGNGNTQKAGT